VTTGKLIGFAIGAALFALLVFASESGFVFLIDHANLLFHEAGHPIIGLFSGRLEPYGGTVGQLAFPIILAVNFWRKGQPLSFAGRFLWSVAGITIGTRFSTVGIFWTTTCASPKWSGPWVGSAWLGAAAGWFGAGFGTATAPVPREIPAWTIRPAAETGARN